MAGGRQLNDEVTKGKARKEQDQTHGLVLQSKSVCVCVLCIICLRVYSLLDSICFASCFWGNDRVICMLSPALGTMGDGSEGRWLWL